MTQRIGWQILAIVSLFVMGIQVVGWGVAWVTDDVLPATLARELPVFGLAWWANHQWLRVRVTWRPTVSVGRQLVINLVPLLYGAQLGQQLYTYYVVAAMPFLI